MAGFTLASKLGGCMACMHSVFLSVCLFWLAAGIAAILSMATVAVWLGAGAILLSGLWIAHLIAFAYRATRRQSAQVAADTINAARRRFFTQFARALGVAAVLTALPAGSALADKCCTHTSFCRDNNGAAACCPDGSLYLCHDDCKCYATVPVDCQSYSQCTD